MSECVIPGNVAAITLCAARDEGVRYGATVGVQLTITEADGKTTYKAVCTDGRRAAIITGPTLGGTPNVGEARIDAPATTAVLPADQFRGIFGKLGPAEKYDGCDDRKALVILGKKRSVLASRKDGTIQKRETNNIEGRFPPIDSVLPKGKPKAIACVDPTLLISLLKIAAGLADEHPKCFLEIHKGKKVATPKGDEIDGGYLVVRVKNSEGQELTAIIVQLSQSPK